MSIHNVKHLFYFFPSIAIVQYSQLQPFSFLTTLVLYSIGLSIQFLFPISQLFIYICTFYFLPVSLPLPLTIIVFGLLCVYVWYFRPDDSDEYFKFLTSYRNLMVSMTFILLKATCDPPGILVITYSGVFAGISSGLQIQIFTSFRLPLALLSILHGGRHDPLGFIAGLVTATFAFHHFTKEYVPIPQPIVIAVPLPVQDPLPIMPEIIPPNDFPPEQPQLRPRRRLSVGGPRPKPRPASIDSIANQRPTRQLPAVPRSAPHRISYTPGSNSTLPQDLQAHWNDNLFELQERLGESSSRVTFKVREKRSGLLYVRKTFYSRQTSGSHIIRHLFDLIAHQDSPDASSNVVRCYGAYFPEVESEAVRGIFEFCEGGSLHSISNVITQRGAIVGEKVAGRIASGMLQGLNFLHGLNMVHFNVRPSNVFITHSGMIKLSEPEIPGEGAVALTDRFVQAVGYASPERITGNPVNPSKSDVWALGLTLLEFVQNRYPYPELPTIELMIRIVQGEPPYLQDGTNATYSPRMKTFFTQCLLIDETHRPTAQALLSNPWVLGVANQNVRMDKWIREVWS